jgi:hypothetical protein
LQRAGNSPLGLNDIIYFVALASGCHGNGPINSVSFFKLIW